MTIEMTPLNIQVMTNPSAYYFTIRLSSSNTKERINVRIVDATGKTIEVKTPIVNQPLQLGHKYRPGTYYCIAKQGRQHTTVKLVKVSD